MINHIHNPAPTDTDKLGTFELQELYEVIGFCAPYVEVKRKSDGVEGAMQFNGIPRYYFDFQPNK